MTNVKDEALEVFMLNNTTEDTPCRSLITKAFKEGWKARKKSEYEETEYIRKDTYGAVVADLEEVREELTWEYDTGHLIRSAADRITEQAAEIERLRDALNRIVSASDYYCRENTDHEAMTLAYAHKSTGHIARAGLKE